eukprot:gene11852-5181_t
MLRILIFCLVFIGIKADYLITGNFNEQNCQGESTMGSAVSLFILIAFKGNFWQMPFNSTHFVEMDCDPSCKDCRHRKFEKFACDRPPGDNPRKKAIGKMPRIEKTGFKIQMFPDSKCSQKLDPINFFTKESCFGPDANLKIFFAKNQGSAHSLYNVEKEQAEIYLYSEKNCRGNVIDKRKYKLNKCYAEGPGFMTIFK